jgi:hypothetical protein
VNLSRDRLFALAEISFMHAEDTRQPAYYLAAKAPLEQLEMKPTTRVLLEKAMFFAPSPDVTRKDSRRFGT